MITDKHKPLEYPSKTRRWLNVGSMLAFRLRRRANIEPTMVQRLVFAGTLRLPWQGK